MPIVDNSALNVRLTENLAELSTIWTQRTNSLEALKDDFIPLRIDQKISLKRESLGNIVQPSDRIATNFTTSFLVEKERIAFLEALKVDLNLTELDIYNLSVSWLSKLHPADKSDVTSVAGLTYIMNSIFRKAEHETVSGIWTGSRALTGANGGTNLFNGLAVKLAASIVAGDLPAGQVLNVIGAAAVTQATVLAAMKSFSDKILNDATGQLYFQYQPGGVIYVPPIFISFIAEALNANLSNGSQIVAKDSNGTFFLNAFPNIQIKPAVWMIGVNNAFMTPTGNLFYLTDANAAASPALKTQVFNRDLKIFLNWQANVDYADPRYCVVYRAFA